MAMKPTDTRLKVLPVLKSKVKFTEDCWGKMPIMKTAIVGEGIVYVILVSTIPTVGASTKLWAKVRVKLFVPAKSAGVPVLITAEVEVWIRLLGCQATGLLRESMSAGRRSNTNTHLIARSRL